MSEYLGESQHGYWSLHVNGTLHYSKNCNGVEPFLFFSKWTTVKWWKVLCELDWYRMMKESKQLAEGPLEPMVA